MSRWIITFILGLEFSLSVPHSGPIWSYDDEKKWPGDKCKEGGKRQSPIDIRTEDIIKDFNNDFIKYGTLKFTGYETVLVSGINNGHTVQFSTEGDVAMHPVLTGGPLKHQYRLEQMHFHWLSEHSLNGIKYPMEIHFVHVRSDLSVVEALKKRDGLSIVALFCNPKIGSMMIGASSRPTKNLPFSNNKSSQASIFLWDIIAFFLTEEDPSAIIRGESDRLPTRVYFEARSAAEDLNTQVQAELEEPELEATEEIMDKIPELLETGDRVSGVILNMTKLLGPATSSYYTYAGSLTSPQCNEAVIWIVLDKAIFMTDLHYRLFGKIGVGRHNFRSLQRLNRHQVFTPVTSHIQTPQMVLFLEKVVKIVAQFFRNVTTFMNKTFKKNDYR